MEEHLLERVTAIENNISRVIDKLEKMAELMLKQSRSSYFDHELLDTLITVLGESGVVSRKRLAALWRERRKKVTDAVEPASRYAELREGVLGAYAGGEPELFGRLVREGFGALEKGRATAGLRTLERAAALAHGNAPLNAFLGEQLLRKGRNAPARDYFTRALDADPENARLRLLLGLACGDEGDAARARTLLTEAAVSLVPSFAAHCALGRLSAAEADWKGALAEFRLALAARPGPEAHYLLGFANAQLGRERTALRHLMKAVGLDASFAAAFYLLGLVSLRLGELKRASEAFETAAALDPEAPGYREALEDPKGAGSAATPSLFGAAVGRRRARLLTGGEPRLAAALLEDALGSVAAR
jgi:tetratricopeptide (TPR) repeat protein